MNQPLHVKVATSKDIKSIQSGHTSIDLFLQPKSKEREREKRSISSMINIYYEYTPIDGWNGTVIFI